MLKIRLLGQLYVEQDQEVIHIPSRPAQSLLAYLALTAGTKHRREKLAGLFWPDSAEDNARSNLRHALWRLRKALAGGEDPILADDLTISWSREGDLWLDTAILEQELPGNPSLEQLQEVVSVYQGELLPGFYEEWVTLERQRLQTAFDQKMDLLLAHLLAAGRWSDAIKWAEDWIALGQVPEPAYRALMVARAGLGDRAGVAVAYERCSEALRLELEVPPSPQTRSLFERLATGEVPAAAAGPDMLRVGLGSEGPEPGEPPFKGLPHFEETDADLFFGREQLTAHLVAHLNPELQARDRWGRGRFLAVVGASGSGKSSLVRAGLIPALKRGRPLADGSSPPRGSEHWPIHVITPTAHPLQALAATLTGGEESPAATSALMEDLARDPRSLHLYVQRKLSPGNRRLLLVVDHFEELFTLCRTEVERQRFVDNLLVAVCTPIAGAPEGDCGGGESLSVVLVLRADFYTHCGRYAGLREVLERHQVYVGPMSGHELRRAIEEPARQGGWSFEPGLVDLFLQEVGDEPGRLPLLSHALLETWERRRRRMLTLSGFHESGGVRGAIARTAERVLDEMDPEQQAVARGIFLRLTELGDGSQYARRSAGYAELVTGCADPDRLDVVLHRLIEARLITAEEDVVQVAHEALIREWPTLRQWLDEDRAALRLHRHLTESAQAWMRRGRDRGELYRGARLAQATEFAEAHAGELNPLEEKFLAASQAQARKREAAREARRQRELEAAQRLAGEQTRAAAAEKRRAEVQARASRHLRWLAAALGLLLLVALTSAFLALDQARRASQQTRIATARELAAASLTQLDADPERSILLALEAVDVTQAAGGFVLPEAANALHRAIPASRMQLSLAGHTGQVWGLAYHPDGRRLATGSDDGTARIWDARTGQALLTLTGHRGPLNAVAFGPDGTRLATAGLDDTARVWDAATGRQLLVLRGHADDVLDVAFDPEGRRLATAGFDASARVWDAASGEEMLVLAGHEGLLSGIAFSPDGRHLATASQDGTARLWDLGSGQELLSLTGHTSSVADVAFSPDGTRLATAGLDATAMIWDIAEPLARNPEASSTITQPLLVLAGHTNEVIRVAFGFDGKHLATASADRQVIVWDLASGREALRLAGHTGWVTNVAFGPDGQHLATASTDNTARVWDWASPSRELLTLTGHEQKLNGLALSPDGTRLATTGRDEVTRVWDLATGAELLAIAGAGAAPRIWTHHLAFSPDGTRLTTVAADGVPRVWDSTTGQEILALAGHDGPVWHVDYGPDGTRLVTAGQDRTARIWNADTGQEMAVLAGHRGPILHATFSPDGTMVATASEDHTARIWDAATGREMFTLAGHSGWLHKAVFAPDGARLVTVPTTLDRTPKVWDTATGQELLTLAGHLDSTWDAAFSPDGKRLATAGKDGTVRLWDALTGEELHVLAGHTSSVYDLAFSPDGARLVTAGFDAQARVWDVATGQELLVLSGHAKGVNAVTFGPDGTRLITASDDGTVRIYALPIEDVVALARERLTRTWTPQECRRFLRLPEDQCPPGP